MLPHEKEAPNITFCPLCFVSFAALFMHWVYYRLLCRLEVSCDSGNIISCKLLEKSFSIILLLIFIDLIIFPLSFQSFMDLQFPNGQVTYLAGEGISTSAFLPLCGGLLQAQGQYPGEMRFSFSCKVSLLDMEDDLMKFSV